MNREIISDALNRVDIRHISETAVFAPEAVQGVEKRSELMQTKTHRSTSKRFVTILVAACLVMSLGIVAYAAVTSGWFAGRDADIAPTNTQQFISEAGFEPIRIHSFRNGYTYVNSKVIDNQTTDAENNGGQTFKSALFEYEKNGDMIYFNQDNSPQNPNAFGSLMESYNGIELWLYSYTNKFVPDGYEMTALEKEAEEKDELIITYGVEEIFSAEVRSLSWRADGMNCNLMQMDGKLSAEEICAMAKEIIDGDYLDYSSNEANEKSCILLDSGSNLNDNYYKKVDYSGKTSNLTANSFVMGEETPVTNMQSGADHSGALTIHYDENTVIKTACLYYSADKYEIYMGSVDDLVVSPNYLYEIVLEDPNATELWAKEIIVSEFIF